MTNIPLSASDDTVKPATPVTPQQQTQGNPPMPADKPSEQQKSSRSHHCQNGPAICRQREVCQPCYRRRRWSSVSNIAYTWPAIRSAFAPGRCDKARRDLDFGHHLQQFAGDMARRCLYRSTSG